jgi:hypothetical protein
VIDNLNQVPAAWRSEYVALPNGKFELQVIGAIMDALRKERAFRASIWKLSAKAPSLRAAIHAIEKNIATTNPTTKESESATS